MARYTNSLKALLSKIKRSTLLTLSHPLCIPLPPLFFSLVRQSPFRCSVIHHFPFQTVPVLNEHNELLRFHSWICGCVHVFVSMCMCHALYFHFHAHNLYMSMPIHNCVYILVAAVFVLTRFLRTRTLTHQETVCYHVT